MKMKSLRYMLTALGLLACLAASAQVDKRDVRRGNRQFRKEDYKEADISYRKALVKDSTSFAANYNLASTLYRQGNAQEAAAQLQKIAQAASLSPNAPDYYFNLGDCALAQQDWNTAIQAFQQVLLRNPGDMEAKENLAYAKLMQQDQEGGGGGQDQNQDQDQNQNQDQQNQDQNQDQDQQNQDQNQNQDQQDQDQNQGQGQQPVKISPQQAQQMLQAIQAKEKETQEKVKKAEAEAAKSRQKEKNW